MGVKGVVLGAYAFGLGGVLLLSDSGVATGLGVALIGLTLLAAASRHRPVLRSS
ncbi:MAG: hypothetical protein ABEK02_00605 [Haloquadratum sp.]